VLSFVKLYTFKKAIFFEKKLYINVRDKEREMTTLLVKFINRKKRFTAGDLV